MPTISAWVVEKPRIYRNCEGYRCGRLMPPRKLQVRLYGNASQGDPCFEMFICLKCAELSEDEKIKRALTKAHKTGTVESI